MSKQLIQVYKILENAEKWIVNMDHYPKIVEMEVLSKRFIPSEDTISSSESDLNDSQETVFTYGTDDDGDDNNGDTEDIGNREPNNNNRFLSNRNIRRSTRDYYYDVDDGEELESEDSDLFNPRRKSNDDTVERLESIQEQARLNEVDDESWSAAEPLLSCSIIATNTTSSKIRTPESTSACNMTSFSLKSLEPLLTSSWRGSQLHLLRTICDIDTSLQEEIFQDCVEIIKEEIGEEKTITESDQASTGVIQSEEVVMLSDLSSCSSFGSCFDDPEEMTFSPEPGLSFGTCFEDSDALKSIQESDLEKILECDSENTATRDMNSDPESCHHSRSRTSSHGSFEFILSPEIDKTRESMYLSCKSEVVWVEDSDSNLKKLGEAKDTLVETFEGTKKRLSSAFNNFEGAKKMADAKDSLVETLGGTKKRLSSTLNTFRNWRDSATRNEQELAVTTVIGSKVKIESDIKVTQDKDDEIENISLNSDLLSQDLKQEDSFEVIHDSECSWSCKISTMNSGYQPLEATSDSTCHGHPNCALKPEQMSDDASVGLPQNFAKEELSSSASKVFCHHKFSDQHNTGFFERTISLEGLLSDTESRIDETLNEDGAGNKIQWKIVFISVFL